VKCSRHRVAPAFLVAAALAVSSAWGRDREPAGLPVAQQEPAPQTEPAEPFPQTAPASRTAPAPETAPPSPQTKPAGRPGPFFLFGLGGGAGSTEQFKARIPIFYFEAGASVPIGGKAWTDIALGLGLASYHEEIPATTWSGDVQLKTLSVSASLRAGHPGRKVGAYGSAGAGLAYARLGEAGGFGVYPAPVGSTMAPVLIGAASLEHVGRRSRFVTELRYSWIPADLGEAAGGTLNAGGVLLLFGWRRI
jgi:hypothetical protein